MGADFPTLKLHCSLALTLFVSQAPFLRRSRAS